MSRGPDRATLLLSIDVGGAGRSNPEALRWLADSLEDHALPATWAVSLHDWQRAVPLINRVARADGSEPAGQSSPPFEADGTHAGSESSGHQGVPCAFAISMPSPGMEVPRGRLAAELAAHLGSAAHAACRPEAMLLRGGVPPHLDLLARAGIRAVSLWNGPHQNQTMWGRIASWWSDSAATPPPARLLRHGVWELPISLATPGTAWRTTIRMIEHCLSHGTLLHVAIWSAEVNSAPARAGVAQLLACLALRHEQGVLAAETLPGYVALLTAPRSQHRARSILRPRAA